jgi:uncharacterized protein
MIMGGEPGGVFDVLLKLTRFGLGGPLAGGGQFVAWIHASDFVRAVAFLLERDELSGPVNLAAPDPLPQREFMAALRAAWGAPMGLSATRWMAELGALVIGTDTELVLKSRRVVPRKLLDAGFTFEFPDWHAAALPTQGSRPSTLRARARSVLLTRSSQGTIPHASRAPGSSWMTAVGMPSFRSSSAHISASGWPS